MIFKNIKWPVLILMVLLSCMTQAQVDIMLPGSKQPGSFAVITDSKTFKQTREAILEYKKAVEEDGLATYVISADWQSPDEVRDEIIKLKKSDKLFEGFVLVGDIPVACIRNAQHMTSAFKMNEETFPFPQSSVPSDRFYDDLHLSFELLYRDSVTPSHFYYKLKEESPQTLHPELYSARIIYPEKKGGDKYLAIADFLKKAAAYKKEQKNKLDHFVSFTGSAYNSECLTAWLDEGKALRENFPYAWADATNAKHLNFRMDNFMKFRLFDELQRPEVDLFIFHEHGLPTEQLINNEPPGISFESRYEVFRSSLYSYAKRLMKRNKLPADTAIAYLSEEYSVLPAFFDKLNDPEQMKKDSAIEADMYISTLDLARINTYPRAVILDACYNGSFHEDDYIAGYYIFNKGNTLVVSANSRNVLQDKWTMEFSGLLSYGVRFGNYFRLISTLEGHLMGDPTVRFAPGDKKSDYTNIFHQIKNKAGWKPLLKKDNPDIQCLALRSLTDLDVNQELSRDLLDIFKTSPYNVVRMEALKQLSRYNNQYFTNAITLALKDPYELIARQAAMYAGDQGDESLIAPMSEAFLYYPERKRVHYNLTSSFNQFPVKKVRTTVTSMLNTSDFMTKDSRKAEINDYFQSTEKQLENSLQKVKDKNLSPAKRISEIRMIRNYNYHYNTDTYLKILSDPQEDVRVRIALAEALGWFTHSYKKTDLIRTCKQLSAEDNLPAELRNELIQTINRLQ